MKNKKKKKKRRKKEKKEKRNIIKNNKYMYKQNKCATKSVRICKVFITTYIVVKGAF